MSKLLILKALKDATACFVLAGFDYCSGGESIKRVEPARGLRLKSKELNKMLVQRATAQYV